MMFLKKKKKEHCQLHTVSYHLCIYTFAYNVFLNEGVNYKINKMVTNRGGKTDWRDQG